MARLCPILGVPRLPLPVDVTDAARFPNIARARAELAALPKARRDQLEREWNA